MAKLLSKRIIKLSEAIPVYDLTSDKYQNFSIENGCIVHNSKDAADGCLSGDTLIPLLNGKTKTIIELKKDFDSSIENYVYSSTVDGNIIIGKIINAIYSGKKKIYRVYLDNGKCEKVTGDHLFMMRDGSYKQAQDLVMNDSLMPLYRKISDGISEDKKLIGYELLYDNKLKKWVYTHYLSVGKMPVARFQNEKGKWITKPVVHHSDFDKRNNNPTNVKWLSWKEHMKIHHDNQSIIVTAAWKRGAYDEMVKNRVPSVATLTAAKVNITKYNKSSEKTKKLRDSGFLSSNGSIVLSKVWKDHYDLMCQNTVDRNNDRISLGIHNFQTGKRNSLGFIGQEPTKEHRELILKNNSTKRMCTTILGVANKIKSDGLSINSDNWLKYKSTSCPTFNNIPIYFESVEKLLSTVYNNHKVISVEMTEEIEDVYDLTIQGESNFALDSGIIVHNCAGSLYSAFNDFVKFPIMQSLVENSTTIQDDGTITFGVQ